MKNHQVELKIPVKNNSRDCCLERQVNCCKHIHGGLLLSFSRPGYYLAQIVKNQPTMQEIQVRPLGWEDPLERSQVGCSPWHRKESDMTKGLTLSPKDTIVFVPQVSVLLLRVFTSTNRSAWQSAHPWSAAPELREGLTSGLSQGSTVPSQL